MADTRGVFFDLYGTLVVYGDMTAAWRAYQRAIDAHLRRHGVALRPSSLSAVLDGHLSRPLGQARDPRLTVFEQRLQALGLRLDLGLDRAAYRAMAADAAAAWHRYVTLDAEARPLLSELKPRMRLALVTNFDHPPHVLTSLAKWGLDELFDEVLISGALGWEKPDPAIFRHALRVLRLHPEEVVHVGDADEDVEGARRAGLRAIRIVRDDPHQTEIARDFRTDPNASSRGAVPRARAGEVRIPNLAALRARL